MELLAEFGLFLAKTLTLLGVALVLMAGITAMASRNRPQQRDRLVIRKLNDRYRDMERSLSNAFLDRRGRRKLRRQKKQEEKLAAAGSPDRERVFVLRFHGDLRASYTENLREEVSAILTQARPEKDRVVACVESAGGLVHSYGLAAAQLARIRDHGIDLTVAVDRVAASGGYLMAAVGHRIIASPFAILGSIGVVAQLPNFHRLLQRHDVDYELITAGEHKRTLTIFGKNTDEGRQKMREELDDIHRLFKTFVHRYRKELDLDRVATGEHWFGEQALALGLADSLETSDDLLMRLGRESDVFELRYEKKQPITRRLSLAIENTLARVFSDPSR